jgi:hypothetical protein
MPSTEPSDNLVTFERIATAFAFSLMRLISSRIVSITAEASLLRLHDVATEDDEPRDPDSHVIDQLRAVSYEEFDAFRYISRVSQLVYATTLLDTFLTDATRFLLMLYPASLGATQIGSVQALLEGASIADLLTSAVNKKVRDISYSSFAERLNLLRTTFGLNLPFDQADLDSLNHYSSIRNVIVHDQGLFELTLDPSGKILCQPKTCPRHPTPVTSRDFYSALIAYTSVFAILVSAVSNDVLKAPQDHSIHKLVLSLQGLRELAESRRAQEAE